MKTDMVQNQAASMGSEWELLSKLSIWAGVALWALTGIEAFFLLLVAIAAAAWLTGVVGVATNLT